MTTEGAATKDGIGVFLILAGIFTAFGSLTIPVWQAYFWLRHGVWPELPLAATWRWLGWSFPYVEWVGIEKLVSWAFDQATSVWLFLSGLGLMVLGVNLPK